MVIMRSIAELSHPNGRLPKNGSPKTKKSQNISVVCSFVLLTVGLVEFSEDDGEDDEDDDDDIVSSKF